MPTPTVPATTPPTFPATPVEKFVVEDAYIPYYSKLPPRGRISNL